MTLIRQINAVSCVAAGAILHQITKLDQDGVGYCGNYPLNGFKERAHFQKNEILLVFGKHRAKNLTNGGEWSNIANIFGLHLYWSKK